VAGDGGEFGLGGHDADGEIGVFALVGGEPFLVGVAKEVFEAISRDVAGDEQLGFAGERGLGRKRFGEPIEDFADDLADAGLRDICLGGDLAGAGEFDHDAFIDEEIAGAGGEGNGRQGCGHGRLQGKGSRFQVQGSKLGNWSCVPDRRKGDGHLWSI